MTGRYKAYSDYKDSGSYWLGKIPTHWAATELKRYSFVKGGYAFSSESFKDSGKPVIRIGDIKQDGSVSVKNCKYIDTNNSTQFSEYLVNKGDLLMAMTGATIGKAGWYLEDETALLNQRVGAFKCNKNKLNYQFFWYVLNSLGYQSYISLTAFGGAQPNISDTGMVGYYSAVPTIQEQQKIANFLDHETAKIDTLIAKQEKLIELLKEKRQAVISHAVTKGLNPNAPMRDSGVEWLGEVPEHWEVLPTKRFFRLVTEPSIKNHGQELLSVYTAIGVAPRKDLEQKGNKASNTDGYWAVRKGDIIVNKLLAWMGAIGYSDYDGVTSPAYDILRKTKDINPKFYHYLFRQKFTQNEFKRWSRGIMEMRLRLYFEELGRIMMPMPSKEEQNAIVQEIEKMHCIFAELEDKANLQIELLKERKTALISAAVTGKIDVRDGKF
ncbi:restriction endonuclease subunit S [Pseudoalteromonas sp. AOP31-A2-14]|uniref:restriction endonuclease subunit S n=1 Tax=Pseudoalteromonas sp. AOP31-A2-14 TaxID=3457695 RepID=UPI00403545E2